MDELKIIDGKKYSKFLLSKITDRVSYLHKKHNIIPGLAIILVGNNYASEVYIRNKIQKTIFCGMNYYMHKLPFDITEDNLVKLIQKLNNDIKIHGIICQLPLPSHIHQSYIADTIAPHKDVDGMHILNIGSLIAGKKNGFIPCTPLGCLFLLKKTIGRLNGLHAVIIGRSNIVGNPLSQLLLKENCTVTITHSYTQKLYKEVLHGDIVISAVGKPHMIKKHWIKSGAFVIDVGITQKIRENGSIQLIGDVDFNRVAEKAGAITPVPGGVGPMTITFLLYNTLLAACRAHHIMTSDLDIDIIY